MAMLMAALEWETAANIAVMVVPKLAPNIKGKEPFKETFLVATNGTTSGVVTELD